jgi:heme oxygenase (biliverdin-producing, ferredoxin)
MTTFSAALRAATWANHRRAEETTYLRALVAGRVDRAGYAEMVAQHYFAYVVLEEAGATMRDDAVAGLFVDNALLRVPALEQDLAALLGPDWSTVVSPSPSTRRYCARMREVCFNWPGGFVAHHYTRYLGDLSGGQFLARAIERQLGLDTRTGTAFYDFSAVGDLTAYKNAYRERLDGAPWPATEQARIVTETALAYDLNTEVLVELGDSLRDTAPA